MILLAAGAIVLVVAVAAFVVYPIVRPPFSLLAVGTSQSEELLRRRDRVYAELRELEFDLHVGKVTDADYLEARLQLETEAARILQAIDVEIKAIDGEIEREVKRLRETRRACPSCGAALAPNVRFCPGCGEPVKAVARR
ncbi:MAG: zinc-ribbon domain-containing protein [Candidatus Dormibacteraceae bacterium]